MALVVRGFLAASPRPETVRCKLKQMTLGQQKRKGWESIGRSENQGGQSCAGISQEVTTDSSLNQLHELRGKNYNKLEPFWCIKRQDNLLEILLRSIAQKMGIPQARKT